MTSSPSPAIPLPARPPFLEAFLRVLLGLRLGVGDWAAVGLLRSNPTAIPDALASRIQWRLQRLRLRFMTLAEKALAGTLRPPRARKPRQAGDVADGDAGKPCAADPLPRKFGWLLGLMPTQPPYGGGTLGANRKALVTMLDTDEGLRALLASDYRFGRVLRPLLHMLAIKAVPEFLKLPPRPRKRRAERRSEADAPDASGSARRGRERSWVEGPEGARMLRAYRQPRKAAPATAAVVEPPTPPAAPAPPTPVHHFFPAEPDFIPSHVQRPPRPAPVRREDTARPLFWRVMER